MDAKLLLHICCAPDSTAVFERLKHKYKVIGYFHNPNIHPQEEYEKRKQEALHVASKMGFELIVPPYSPKAWLNTVKGLENEPEGGERCSACFRNNLKAAAEKAKELGISSFTSTLTISPHKRSQAIISIGKSVEKEVGIEFLAADFKKRGGFKRSLELSREMRLYRQKYCGCSFSREGNEVGEGNARTPRG
jgi:predicted adenine nucleotide alpha hydrolase (AANH) superfamily ATPase